jgi:3-deoxy-D-arabino-heptulosonate 7-phosphate (DAHP) synthase
MIEQQIYDLEIIAGPCSVGTENIGEIYQIAEIGAVSGARVVGLKSRTGLNSTGEGMGIDYKSINHAMEEGVENTLTPPSIVFAQDVVSETGLMVATEIMIPEIQLPFFEKGSFPEGKLLAWNPSVNQLGWQVRQTAKYAKRNGWTVGLKNGKALGVSADHANDPESRTSPLEETWAGLTTYAEGSKETILIHRGVDVPEKVNHRNLPVHEVARRVKNRTGKKLFFDPSHIYGPKMRDQIVDETVQAMHMRNGDEFLYDGILIETGTSKTDTKQHITVAELEGLTERLAKFRQLRTPEKVVFEAVMA